MTKAIVAATSITSMAGMLAIAGMLALATPTEARQIRWCAHSGGRAGGTSCMYHTEEQCRASIRGRGGTCVPNRH